MQPIDSESPGQAILEAVIGEGQQASAQVKGLLRTFIALPTNCATRLSKS